MKWAWQRCSRGICTGGFSLNESVMSSGLIKDFNILSLDGDMEPQIEVN